MITLDKILDGIPNFKKLDQKGQVKIIGYYVSQNAKYFDVKMIENTFIENNIKPPSNISRELSNLSKGKTANIIKTKNGYCLDSEYKKEMDGKFAQNKYQQNIESQLYPLIEVIKGQQQKIFIGDAIKCFNNDLFRPAIIMTWLLTMDVLFDFTLNNKLDKFNAELSNRNKKVRITSKADFEDLRESEVLEIMKAAGIISKEQKKILSEKLDIRNSAAHPNSTSFKPAKVESFIDELVSDIIVKFQ